MNSGGITQFHLPPTHEPYVPLLSSRKASPPFGFYSLRLPTKGWPGWVDLGGWLHTEINVPNWELNPDTSTHLGTNRAQCRVTWSSLICTTSLPHQLTSSIMVLGISSIDSIVYVIWQDLYVEQHCVMTERRRHISSLKQVKLAMISYVQRLDWVSSTKMEVQWIHSARLKNKQQRHWQLHRRNMRESCIQYYYYYCCYY